jgi:hypothetical protein
LIYGFIGNPLFPRVRLHYRHDHKSKPRKILGTAVSLPDLIAKATW